MLCPNCGTENQFCCKCGASLGLVSTGEGTSVVASPLDDISLRIAELGKKSTQLLTFLSFAIVAAVLLETSQVCVLGPCEKIALRWAIRFWVVALFPILFNVLALKEFNWKDLGWYRSVRRFKVVILEFAVVLIIFGVIAFLVAIW